MIEWLNANANLLLVVITAVYVWLTYKLLRESKLARQSADVPKILGRLEPYSAVAVRYAITNIGPGAALNVDLHMKMGNHKCKWKHSVMEPNRTEYFYLPSGEMRIDMLRSASEALEIVIQFDDINNKHTAIEQKLDLEQTIKNWESARWAMRKSEIESATEKIIEAIKTSV